MNHNLIVAAGLAVAAASAHAQLTGPVTMNDTGMAKCVDTNGKLTYRCAGTGEDGETGRDAGRPTNADGHAGFKYIKLDDGGHPLARDAATWRCVADRVSGLVWEVKTPGGDSVDGMHALYTNYGDGSEHDTSTLVSKVNAKHVCGATNWRMPTVNELQGLIDYGSTSGPQIDAGFFPNTPDNWFWTSTGYADDPLSTWSIYFSSEAGGDGAGQRMFQLSARLVHDTKWASAPADASTRYAFTGDEVTDTWTNLSWKRCSIGQAFDGAQCTGDLKATEWQAALREAKKEATDAGQGWRVPNAKELSSIMDRTRNYPALDPVVFPNSPGAAYYWTSTPFAADPTQVWTLDIRGGYTQTYPAQGYLLYTRLVRDTAALN